MDRSQLEAYLRRARVNRIPTRRFLSTLHRGEAFTRVFSIALVGLVGTLGVVLGIGWLVSWGSVYREFERWQLVLAFVDQFFLLAMLVLLLHVTFLRAGHLRQVPAGPFVSLQASALILRWLGESALILAMAMLGHALLNVPDISWLSSAQELVKAGSVLVSGWNQVLGFVTFTVFYAMASAIDVFLAIERNSRQGQRGGASSGEVSGHGHEVRVSHGSTASM